MRSVTHSFMKRLFYVFNFRNSFMIEANLTRYRQQQQHASVYIYSKLIAIGNEGKEVPHYCQIN